MLYSRTSLFILSIYNSLHLLIPNPQSFPSPSLFFGNHKPWNHTLKVEGKSNREKYESRKLCFWILRILRTFFLFYIKHNKNSAFSLTNIYCYGEFPSSPLVRTPSFHYQGYRFSPWSRNWDPASCKVRPLYRPMYCFVCVCKYIHIYIAVNWEGKDWIPECK